MELRSLSSVELKGFNPEKIIKIFTEYRFFSDKKE